jgi:hypothetical protein
MKRLICGLGSLLVALPCYVATQDLEALAAKERERRKEQAKVHPTPVRVVTDDDMDGAARRRELDTGKTGTDEGGEGGVAAPRARGSRAPADESTSGVEAAEKMREVLAEDRRQQLASQLRNRLRYADDDVRSAEDALREAKRVHDKVPMATPGESPFAARHRSEEGVHRAERALDDAKKRRGAIEDEALNAGLDPDDLH